MKRSLYPVVKHGARLALVGGLLVPAFCFLVGLLITQGNLLATQQGLILLCCPETHSQRVSLAIIFAECVFFTVVVALYERGRRRRLAADPAPPKLKADANSPLLPATSPGTIAGGKIDL